MRIMLLITGLRLGGAEQQVAALARQYVGMGHDVAVVSLTPDCEVELPRGIAQMRLDMRKTPWSMADALLRVRRMAMAWQPDVMHAHMVHANLFTRILARICPGSGVVCTAHSFHEGGGLRMLGYRLTDRWANLTTHVSSEGRQRMIEVGAAPAQRIVVMPNGIDTRRFCPDAQARAATRAELGLDASQRLVLNVGRLVPEKAQSVLLDAFHGVAADSDAMLMIAGEGHLRGALEKQIDRLGLAGRVVLLGKRHDIPALLNAADLFVLSSVIEGMPLAVGEALACGCPVVSTDASGVADLLAEFGKPVPRGDCQALAGAMRDALALGRGSTADEQARYEHIATRFGIEAVARQWLFHYLRHAGPATPAARMHAV